LVSDLDLVLIVTLRFSLLNWYCLNW